MKYLEIAKSNFVIPGDTVPTALEALKQLNKDTPNSFKRGSDGVLSWFSWLPPVLNEYKTIVKLLRDMGFRVRRDRNNGNVHIVGFAAYRGQEAVFIAELARYVKVDSYMIWTDEMGMYLWLWKVEKTFDRRKIIMQYEYDRKNRRWAVPGKELGKLNKQEMRALNAIKVKHKVVTLEGREEVVSV